MCPGAVQAQDELERAELSALLEAARWAPSSQNSQPWRFLVTRRSEGAHGRLFAALGPGNQAWAGAASALVLVAARDSTLTPIVILAIGRRDGTAELPEPLAAREAAPRARRPLSDLLLPAAAESVPTAA